MNFTFKIKNFYLKFIPNDVQIVFDSYLADADGVPMINTTTDNIDTFNVTTLKSSLPTSNYESFFITLAEGFINDKYTVITGGTLSSGSKIVSDINDTSSLVPGMNVSGSGVPTGTTIENIRSTSSIKMTQNATTTGASSLTFDTQGWTIDYTSITYITTVVNFGSL